MSGKTVSDLSEGQIECLRGVLAHMGSKEIAARLGISHHTVDDRIKAALRTLGVASRREAARLLAEAERGRDPLPLAPGSSPLEVPPAASRQDDISTGSGEARPQPLVPQSPGMAGAAPVATDGEAAGGTDGSGSFPLPFRTLSRPRNDLTVVQRLAWIVALTAGSIFALGVLIAGLVALSQVI